MAVTKALSSSAVHPYVTEGIDVDFLSICLALGFVDEADANMLNHSVMKITFFSLFGGGGGQGGNATLTSPSRRPGVVRSPAERVGRAGRPFRYCRRIVYRIDAVLQVMYLCVVLVG